MAKYTLEIVSDGKVKLGVSLDTDKELEEFIAPDGFIATQKLVNKVKALGSYAGDALTADIAPCQTGGNDFMPAALITAVRTEVENPVEKVDTKCPKCGKKLYTQKKDGTAYTILSEKQVDFLKKQGKFFKVGESYRRCACGNMEKL